MSYDISLVDPITKKTLQLDAPHQMRGGTYCVGGTREARLNVTYNYRVPLYKALGEEGIRIIYDKTGAESLPLLTAAIKQLGDDVDENYWEATEGNTKRALLQLVALANLRSDGVWEGD